MKTRSDNLLKSQSEETLSFPQIFLIGILFLFALRILGWAIFLALANISPEQTAQSADWLTRYIPLPLFILILPIGLAIGIITWAGSRKNEEHDEAADPAVISPENSEVLSDEAAENRRLFAPRYTRRHLYRILQIMGIVWFVILMTQIVFLFAFQSYR